MDVKINEAKNSQKKWFLIIREGLSRKWFGNNDTLVNYENDGFEIKNLHPNYLKVVGLRRLKSREYYFKEAISWVLLQI
jgi:hypothetical protein